MARRLPGKRIDKWGCYVSGITHEFEVRLLDDDRFMINSLGEDHLRVEGSNLAELKREAKKRLTKIVATDWVEWLCVDMRSDDGHWQIAEREEIDFSLNFEVTRVMFGKTAKGEKVHKDKAERMAIRKGWPNEMDGLGTIRRRCSYIKATSENEVALADIANRLCVLGEKLLELLGRDEIERSLAGLAAKLLPAPEKVKEVKVSRKKRRTG